MSRRRRARVQMAVGGVPLLACLLGVAAPALAQTPPGATITVVPANQTKLILLDPGTPAAEAPGPVPATVAPAPPAAVARRASSPSQVTVLPVAADSPALRAMVEAATAERRRLGTEVVGAEARVGESAAVVAAADAVRVTDAARVASLAARVDRARANLDLLSGQVARVEASAATATDAVQARRTPVARPPAPGHTPQEAATQARQALAVAAQHRLDSGRALADLETELDTAQESADGSSAALVAGVLDLQAARETLAALRQQLADAEQRASAIPGPPSALQPTSAAAAALPAGWLSLYGRAAATCPGLPWTVLAAVGSVESGHGQSTAAGVRAGANVAGAMGPMQFLAGTWTAYGVDGDGDGIRDVYNPDDAVFGAARYLCATGGGSPSTLRSALWAYNHADWYVDLVLDLAARY